MLCPRCRSAVGPENKFCHECGLSLRPGSQENPRSPDAPERRSPEDGGPQNRAQASGREDQQPSGREPDQSTNQPINVNEGSDAVRKRSHDEEPHCPATQSKEQPSSADSEADARGGAWPQDQPHEAQMETGSAADRPDENPSIDEHLAAGNNQSKPLPGSASSLISTAHRCPTGPEVSGRQAEESGSAAKQSSSDASKSGRLEPSRSPEDGGPQNQAQAGGREDQQPSGQEPDQSTNQPINVNEENPRSPDAPERRSPEDGGPQNRAQASGREDQQPSGREPDQSTNQPINVNEGSDAVRKRSHDEEPHCPATQSKEQPSSADSEADARGGAWPQDQPHEAQMETSSAADRPDENPSIDEHLAAGNNQSKPLPGSASSLISTAHRCPTGPEVSGRQAEESGSAAKQSSSDAPKSGRLEPSRSPEDGGPQNQAQAGGRKDSQPGSHSCQSVRQRNVTTTSTSAAQDTEGNTDESHPETASVPERQQLLQQPSPSKQRAPGGDLLTVYFRAITSQEFQLNPKEDRIFLRSAYLFGSWDKNGPEMFIIQDLNDQSYLVEGCCDIPKEYMNHSIPYKYIVYKHLEEDRYQSNYEVIYESSSDPYTNRCLFIRQDLLTQKGGWHQYDDVIRPKLSESWWRNAEKYVIDGRNHAGMTMLGKIFDQPKTWSKQGLEDFLYMMQQFCHGYSRALVHDRGQRNWSIPYGEKQVQRLLSEFLVNRVISQQGSAHFTHQLCAGVTAILVCTKYLKGLPQDPLSKICDLLCLPKMPPHHFKDFWEEFTKPLTDQMGVADAVQRLCSAARSANAKNWFLVLPLIHLLRGECQPYEPASPLRNLKLESWTGHGPTYNSPLTLMNGNQHLVDIDRLLGFQWLSLLNLDDAKRFLSNAHVELLDILHFLQFSLGKTSNRDIEYKGLGNLVAVLITRANTQQNSYDGEYIESCFKTAVGLLGMICRFSMEQRHCDIPLQFLDLVRLIANSFDDAKFGERLHIEALEETLETVREWRRNTFPKKLLKSGPHFNSTEEIKVWNRLISFTCNQNRSTSFWTSPFVDDFEGKLRTESPMDRISIYCSDIDNLHTRWPSLSESVEKCAFEAVATICQDKSRKEINHLLEKHDVRKFRKLISVIVVKSWPTDEAGHFIASEDLVMEHLLNWPLATTVFQAEVAGKKIDPLTPDALLRMESAISAFRSTSEKFFNGNIQMKTLNKILHNADCCQQFAKLAKIDGLCEDGRCNDNEEMTCLLELRKAQVKAIQTERELVKGLLQVCQEVPKHVKVDFNGLDNKLAQNIETMTLDELIEEVRGASGEQTTGLVKYFDLDENTRQMASQLQKIKESSIFKVWWSNRVEELSRGTSEEEDGEGPHEHEEIYTLDQIHSQIFQSCYDKYLRIYTGLKNATLSLEEVDDIFEDYRESDSEMRKELDIMCKMDTRDGRKWITERIRQLGKYRDLHRALESAKLILEMSQTVCPNTDFPALEPFREMNEPGLKKKKLHEINARLLATEDILGGITDDGRTCLRKLGLSKEFVQWVKEALKDINELKVFVDLASISAGENAQDVDRVAFFHDSILGYSSVLYGLEPKSDLQAFKEALTNLWKALENDKNLPKKLRDTARHLEWWKTVKESHGSVERSSLSLATSINQKGIYIVKAGTQNKFILENSLMLQIQEGHTESSIRTYNLEELRELQNKLMLMSRRGQQHLNEVDHFAEVFDSVQRLARVFVDICAAGNPLFRYWRAEICCNTQRDPGIIMEFNICKESPQFTVSGKTADQLPALCKMMELFLGDWQNFMDRQRCEHYYLNYFTAEQIVYLCNALTRTNMNAQIEDKALMMLSFIKPSCSVSDVWNAWARFHKQCDQSNETIEDVQYQTAFKHQDDSEDTCGTLRKVEAVWKAYMENMGVVLHDTMDVRTLGGVLQMLAVTEGQEEDEYGEPMLSETRDDSVRRALPKGLFSGQPNLVICPHDEILASSICLYMTNDYEQLPTYDEVLLCKPTTPYEQVELILRRCLTPGYPGRKTYAILWADQLSYDVSYAMEKCFQKLGSLWKHDYKLVIYCSSERESTYIPTAFSQFRRNFVPHEPLERIQKYLSRHNSFPSDEESAASLFKRGQSVGIVSSQRAGVGKSLYVQRLYEKLERTVKSGTAFKKCIRLTDHEIDDHKVLLSLFDTPRDRDHKVFHFDVTSSVQRGLDEFLFKLLFLRCLSDSDGLMWQCSRKHLYIIELLETTYEQPTHNSPSGQKENFAFFEVFPKVFCHPPKKVMEFEINRRNIPDLESDEPLMDDECFRSQSYQRPFQYLSRFQKNENLDKFTFLNVEGTYEVEGTHEECLQILFFYCGVIDPSWAELRNFTWFLNCQLKDCENSDFCKFDFIDDTLHGFKSFVVKCMILMSKDFATPSLCITDQSPGTQDPTRHNERDLAAFIIRKRWEFEPHPYIFFNSDRTSMTFIGFHLQINASGVDAINPLTKQVIKKNIMTRKLYNGLRLQGVPFDVDFDNLSRADKIDYLRKVLGVECSKDPDETYELTTDNVLKMMAIHMRFRCGIPVIIMGETGCGKTKLIKYLCDFRKRGASTENMKLVKVHGGTTSEMIYAKVREAKTLAKNNKEKHGFDSVLFFDEANTTEAISSIKEVMCDKTIQGEQLDSQIGLQIIAACNPYRKHTDKMIERLEASGLGYRVRAEDTEERLGSIPLRQLVYRVQVLPPSMMPLVWDFGQLSDQTEQMYIEQIVRRQMDTNCIDKSYIKKIIVVLFKSQKFMRSRNDECSFVSLRDVERCMQVFLWFHKRHAEFKKYLDDFLDQQNQNQKESNAQSFSPASDRVLWSLLMATGVCYQSCLETKSQYQEILSQVLSGPFTSTRLTQEVQLMQDLLLSGVPMGETIAKNEALKENVFMMVICIELRIPLFIVGKPGSSKSLSKTLVADAMQGLASSSDIFKKLKQIHLVSFQCSPHSTPEGIINTFKQSARFQESKNLDEYISVVVLDEIGLAEDSPKMPLKTLHPLLEEGCIDDEPLPHKRVGFIGISNWALDPAKMNRGMFVSRGDPDSTELIKSAKGICSSDKKSLATITCLFVPFAKAYIKISERGKGYFGLRDFYSLVKMVFSITKASKKFPTADQITEAVLRNFSGKDDDYVSNIFKEELQDSFTKHSINTVDLVKQCITPCYQTEESRYLLILTKNYAALQILQQMLKNLKDVSFDQTHPEIIFGSSFPKDQEYTQICRNINRVKLCMETGQTAVLLNLQNLYESLYDALNQYYVTLGGQKYVDLGLGTHRVKCRVHPNFRLIVIEEKEVVYKQFPIPLINRLEKHYLDINTVLTPKQRNTVDQLKEWVKDFVSSTQFVPSDVFVGYHSDTCASVVLQVTGWMDDNANDQSVLDLAKHTLLGCATPDSVVRLDNSRVLHEERERLVEEYFREGIHSSLADFMVAHRQQQGHESLHFTEVTTFSRLLTVSDTQHFQDVMDLSDIQLLSLHQFDTEFSFIKKIRECLDSKNEDKLLIIQTEYDNTSHSRNILSSAKYSCANEINKYSSSANTRIFVYFVINIPRIKGGTSYVGFQGGIWKSFHIDDLRRSKKIPSDVRYLKNMCISQLFKDQVVETGDTPGEPCEQEPLVLPDVFDTMDLLRSCVQSAVSMLRDQGDSGAFSTTKVEILLTVLDGSDVQVPFVNALRRHMHSLLLEYEVTAPFPKRWLLTEASNLNSLQEGGTFTHTLWRKVQRVVTPLLANLVVVIDRDSNMDLLLYDDQDMRNLWLEIFACKEMLEVPYMKIDSDSKVLTVQSHVTAGGAMRCALPFSCCIKDCLDELHTQMLRHDNYTSAQFEDCFWNLPLGRYMADKVNERKQGEFFQRYLQDFVSMTMKAANGEELKLLGEALGSCLDELQRRRGREATCLPLIHTAFHVYSSRLANLSRIISLQPEVVLGLLMTKDARGYPEMVLDVHAAVSCVEHMQSPPLATHKQCQAWLRQVNLLRSSMELLLTQQKARQYGERCKESLQTLRSGWRHICTLSLFVEHMLLGLDAGQGMLRGVVMEHIHKLDRVLAGNSDVKSDKPFQAVVEVLKSCKQAASEHISSSSIDEIGFRRRCNSFFIDLVSRVCFKDNRPPSEGVVQLLLSCLTVHTENQICTKDLSPFNDSMDQNPVVRSVVLKLLLKYKFETVKEYLQQHLSSIEDSRIVADEDKFYALYINCLEDAMLGCSEVQDLQASFPEETEFLRHFLSSAPAQPSATVSVELLQQVARLRRTFRLAAPLIGPAPPGDLPEGAEDFLQAVEHLFDQSGNDWYRVYLIRTICSQRGVELVQTMAKEEGFRWLFPAEILQQSADGGQMDRYLVYGEEYKLVRDAVAKAAVTGNAEEIENVCEACTVCREMRTVFLLLALFREVTALYRSPNPGLHPTEEQCKALEPLVKGSAFLSSARLRGFAEDLVYNRLGALSMCPELGIEENTLVELVVHLAAVLLASDADLLLPLRQLALCPGTMQGAFLPTMPEDMLYSIYKVITETTVKDKDGNDLDKQVTWYVCPNQHWIFVDRCGLPMQRGECPDCKAEIGGEGHKALKDFIKQGKTTADGTKSGHILGDPELRSQTQDALGLKDLPLIPFTLLRMLTHLALMLAASRAEAELQAVKRIIQPAVQDVPTFLRHHLKKDLDQLRQALGGGVDDTITTAHLVIKRLLEPSHSDQWPGSHNRQLSTKESRNCWEKGVANDIIRPLLERLNELVKEVGNAMTSDSRVSSNLILRVTQGDDCLFLNSLPRGSPMHSSAVWSSRQRISLLSLTHIVELSAQREELALLRSFLQKEAEFRQVKFLPDVLNLQRRLVKKVQNASDQMLGSMQQFIDKQKGTEQSWFQKHLQVFLKTWNLLRVSVASEEMKIPEEFCRDLDLDSELQFAVPRRSGAGLVATALMGYLVSLHNQLLYCLERHTKEDYCSNSVSLMELTEQDVVSYDLQRDLLPLVVSHCQYSLRAGQEVAAEYDLQRIQQHIMSRFIQGKPHISLTGLPTLVSCHDRNYESVFKVLKGKVPQESLPALIRNTLSRELSSYSEVSEALRLLQLLLGFLYRTGGRGTTPMVDYFRDELKMANYTEPHILKALSRCCLKHCVALWQLLISLRSESLLLLNREPFSELPKEYRLPLDEEQLRHLTGFVAKGNVDTWLLEMHEFLVLRLRSQTNRDTYKPDISVKFTVGFYMDDKQAEVPLVVEESFPDSITMAQMAAAWTHAAELRRER